MIPDNAMAIGGMIEQQDEVRTQGRGMRCRSVCWVGATDALRTASAPGARNLLETARTWCGVGVCGVCALGRERWGKETTTAFCPGDVCASRLCSQDVGTGGVAPTEGVTVPLPGAATATDTAADAVRAAATVLLLGVGEGAASGGGSDLAGLRDGMSGE